MSEEKPTVEELAAKAEKEKALAEVQAKADAVNKTRSGKGTRVQVGQTRGRSTQIITWEAFDLGQPDTLPKDTSEFLDITKVQDDKVLVSYLIDGFNAANYDVASDPIAEFVDMSWPKDIRDRFRLVVRNYANGANVSIEDAVSLIKPGIDAAAKAAKVAPVSA